MRGYGGKVLSVDLNKERATANVLRTDEITKYIGGVGYAIKLLYDSMQPCVDPLSPENVLILTTGPLSGVMAPAGSAHVFAAKSPLTGAIGVSIAHGFFSASLKRSTVDAIIIKGMSKRATYLWIDDGSVQFMDARDLWGMSPQRTENTIKRDLGDNSIHVAAIGLAGEKLARMACVISDKTRVAGRTGMGAVMGSKNLKAIAVRGCQDAEVADPEGLMNFCKEMLLRAKGSVSVKCYGSDGKSETVSVSDRNELIYSSKANSRDLGTSEEILVHNSIGCLPTRNFSKATFEGADIISGEHLNEKYVDKINACSSCGIGCEHIAIVAEGTYKDAMARMEYGSLWSFGPNCGIDMLDSIIKATELCNHYGLDVISTGNVIAFAMDCYENQILNYEDCDQQDLRFGNAEAMLQTIQNIGCRVGLGDILAEGVLRASQRIGNNAVLLANHIKGLEMPGYDLRCLKTAALGFAVSFRGADSNRHGAHIFDIKSGENRFALNEARGQIVKNLEDLQAVADSLIVCSFLISIYDGFDGLTKLYRLVTGIELSPQDLRKAGERINNLARMFNLREGFTRKDDRLPHKLTTIPMPDGVAKGSKITQEELDLMLDNYYEARGWTREGAPSSGKLEELEITSE